MRRGGFGPLTPGLAAPTHEAVELDRSKTQEHLRADPCFVAHSALWSRLCYRTDFAVMAIAAIASGALI